jgi:hypothetical protein
MEPPLNVDAVRGGNVRKNSYVECFVVRNIAYSLKYNTLWLF